jgi:hypothetical protein
MAIIGASLCVFCELRFEPEETVQQYKKNTTAQPDGSTLMKEAEEILFIIETYFVLCDVRMEAQ